MYWHRFYGKVFKLEIILDLSCMLTFFFYFFFALSLKTFWFSYILSLFASSILRVIFSFIRSFNTDSFL